MNSIKSFVDNLISTKKVAVFSKSYCPFCKKAKSALESFKIAPKDFEWVEIENRSDCEQLQDYLKQLTGARSVPRVFIGGKFFGDGDDTVAGKENGTLEARLKEQNYLKELTGSRMFSVAPRYASSLYGQFGRRAYGTQVMKMLFFEAAQPTYEKFLDAYGTVIILALGAFSLVCTIIAEGGAIRREVGALRGEVIDLRKEMVLIESKLMREVMELRKEVMDLRKEIVSIESRWMTLEFQIMKVNEKLEELKPLKSAKKTDKVLTEEDIEFVETGAFKAVREKVGGSLDKPN